MRHRLLALLVMLALTLLSPAVAAQEATPAAGPHSPEHDLCAVRPALNSIPI